MGRFDTIWFECPECGEKVYGQSKSGPCTLAEYHVHAVPVDVAQDANRHVYGCQCGKQWELQGIPKVTETVCLTIVPTSQETWHEKKGS